jgi:uncharacterized membrane protein YgcG
MLHRTDGLANHLKEPRSRAMITSVVIALHLATGVAPAIPPDLTNISLSANQTQIDNSITIAQENNNGGGTGGTSGGGTSGTGGGTHSGGKKNGGY